MLVRLWALSEGLSTPLILPVGHRPQGSLLRDNLLKVNSLHRASVRARLVGGRLPSSLTRHRNLPEGMLLSLPSAGRGPLVGFSPREQAWLRWLVPAPSLT